MTEIYVGILVALIGGGFLYVTTGSALGAVRSRRAARELLEIRSALGSEDSTSRDTITAAIDKEISQLARLGDTAHRLTIAAALAVGGLILIAWFAMALPTFLIQEDHKELMRYISAGAYLLAWVPLYVVVLRTFNQVSRPRERVATVTVGLILWVALSIAAFVVVQETAYYRQLTGL